MTLPSALTDSPLAVVFDGDDTLWSTESLYDQSRDDARAVVVGAGLDGAEWERIERRVDVENVAKFGFSPLRFPTSCVEAYQQVCATHGIPMDSSVAKQIEAAAKAVFVRTAPLIPGAREVLSYLRDRGARLALLTKGDLAVQRGRVDTSGLAELFDAVRIVSDKTPQVFGELMSALGVGAQVSWMVGNSVRSDVLPALAAGMKAVWIDAHVWEHERTHDHLVDERVVVLKSLTDLPATLAC